MSVKFLAKVPDGSSCAGQPSRVVPPYFSSTQSPVQASCVTNRPSSTQADSLPGYTLGLAQTPMLVVTMCIHGRVGKATLSEAQLPGRPELAMQVVVPMNCRSVCCLGTAESVHTQPAPSGVIAPPATLSST